MFEDVKKKMMASFGKKISIKSDELVKNIDQEMKNNLTGAKI